MSQFWGHRVLRSYGLKFSDGYALKEEKCDVQQKM